MLANELADLAHNVALEVFLGEVEGLQEGGVRRAIQEEVQDVVPIIPPAKGLLFDFLKRQLQLRLQAVQLLQRIFLEFTHGVSQAILPKTIGPSRRRPPQPKHFRIIEDAGVEHILAEVIPEFPAGHQDKHHFVLVLRALVVHGSPKQYRVDQRRLAHASQRVDVKHASVRPVNLIAHAALLRVQTEFPDLLVLRNGIAVDLAIQRVI